MSDVGYYDKILLNLTIKSMSLYCFYDKILSNITIKSMSLYCFYEKILPDLTIKSISATCLHPFSVDVGLIADKRRLSPHN